MYCLYFLWFNYSNWSKGKKWKACLLSAWLPNCWTIKILITAFSISKKIVKSWLPLVMKKLTWLPKKDEKVYFWSWQFKCSSSLNIFLQILAQPRDREIQCNFSVVILSEAAIGLFPCQENAFVTKSFPGLQVVHSMLTQTTWWSDTNLIKLQRLFWPLCTEGFSLELWMISFLAKIAGMQVYSRGSQ